MFTHSKDRIFRSALGILEEELAFGEEGRGKGGDLKAVKNGV